MTRLGIVVEGETEESFVNHLLDAHLRLAGIETETFVLRGNVTVERLSRTLANLLQRNSFVSSLVDYYGFQGKGLDDVNALEKRILDSVVDRLDDAASIARIVPYVQQYEFEALLFSEVSALKDLFGLFSGTVDELAAIRQSVANPEDINDNPATAPSKRIVSIIPNYRKVVHGSLIASRIGLPMIRSQCPRFNQWLIRLESLAA